MHIFSQIYRALAAVPPIAPKIQKFTHHGRGVSEHREPPRCPLGKLSKLDPEQLRPHSAQSSSRGRQGLCQGHPSRSLPVAPRGPRAGGRRRGKANATVGPAALGIKTPGPSRQGLAISVDRNLDPANFHRLQSDGAVQFAQREPESTAAYAIGSEHKSAGCGILTVLSQAASSSE